MPKKGILPEETVGWRPAERDSKRLLPFYFLHFRSCQVLELQNLAHLKTLDEFFFFYSLSLSFAFVVSKLYRHTQSQTTWTTLPPQPCLKKSPLSSLFSSSSFLSPLFWHFPFPPLPLAAEISCSWAELSITPMSPNIAFLQHHLPPAIQTSTLPLVHKNFVIDWFTNTVCRWAPDEWISIGLAGYQDQGEGKKYKMKTTERTSIFKLFTAMMDLKIHPCKFMLQRRCTIPFTTSTTHTILTKHQHSFLPELIYLLSSFFSPPINSLKLEARHCFSNSKLVPDFRQPRWGEEVWTSFFFLPWAECLVLFFIIILYHHCTCTICEWIMWKFFEITVIKFILLCFFLKKTLYNNTLSSVFFFLVSYVQILLVEMPLPSHRRPNIVAK